MEKAAEGSANLKIMFLSWWYGEASAKLFNFLKHFFAYLFDLFSVKICLRTLFVPWKRDYISTEGLSIQDRFQVFLLNMVSRIVGAIIKTVTVITFCLVATGSLVLSGIIVIIWYLYPAVVISLLVFGIKLIIAG